jgi:hypothetical protein
MTYKWDYLVDDIQNVPDSVVKEYRDWCRDDFIMYWQDNKDAYTRSLELNENQTYNLIISRITFENTREALIAFLLCNDDIDDDEYLIEFSKTGWKGFTLFGSTSGRQLIEMIIF